MTAQPMQHKRKLIVNCFVVGAVIVAALVLAWRASGREHIPGVTQWPAGPCVVDWHAKRGALVSACPRQNMTRLWALPLYDDLIDWPDARTLLRLERTFTNKRTGTKSVELDYAFSSLGLDQITAADFLAVWRAHWHIENKLHWVRDVTLNGDASRVRRGNAPQVLAAIRNTLITAARRAGFTNIAEALRAFARSAFRAALCFVGIG